MFTKNTWTGTGKLLVGLLIALTAGSGFLLFQNIKLMKQVKQLSGKGEEVTITPFKAEDEEEQSPFDKPHTDPRENEFASAGAEGVTSLKFEEVVHDFGTIKEGETVKTVFRFRNTGTNPLIISSARGTCGCTVPEYPRHAIKAGGVDEITVMFNSAGKSGEQTKAVNVTANTEPAVTVLTIKAKVEDK